MLSGRNDAADWLRRLRDAALQDEDSKALDGALQTIASFARCESYEADAIIVGSWINAPQHSYAREFLDAIPLPDPDRDSEEA